MTFGRALPIPESLASFARSSEPINSDLLPRPPRVDEVKIELCGLTASGNNMQACGTLVTVLEKTTLTRPGAHKEAIQFSVDFKPLKDWKYQPGDSFDCFCRNDPEIVTELLKIIGIDGSTGIHIIKHPFLTDAPLTVRDLFEKYLDFSQFPKKAFLRHLSEFCTSEEDKRCLLYLSSRLGSSVYLELASQYAGLLDFLATFKSCVPSIDCLLLNLSALSPRSYSVISTRKVNEQELQFVSSIDWYQTPEPFSMRRFGICSQYLSRQVQIGSALELKPRPSTKFCLPLDTSKRMIMICAGAGIAPFISFLRHRQATGINTESWLFYGFRSKETDFLFEQELDGFLDNGTLTKLITATSRAEPKRYVQYAVWDMRAELYSLMIHPDTILYLCGDEMTMIKGVNDALVRILSEHHTIEEANAIFKKWNTDNKLLKDIWL